jgi:hypothetical protein
VSKGRMSLNDRVSRTVKAVRQMLLELPSNEDRKAVLGCIAICSECGEDESKCFCSLLQSNV